jgi:diguanylate cyclase (GGDEF)-like protein
MKILVADDDAISRLLMRRTLENSGYEVVTVVNGREAVRELAQPDGPKLALIDWMMPEVDGPSVCREIRSSNADLYIYILLLTSKESSEDVVRGLEAGADDYLTKPCHPAEIKARLHTGRRILQLEDKLVEAREAMRFKATHDSLTSLWDRGAILALLRSELCRAVREHSCVSILLCDVDHFKNVNDIYGHSTGDEVLQQVSKCLLDSVRSNDAVGRYGGEEFLIVLGGCSEDDLKKRAEHVRKAVCAVSFQTAHGPIDVSVSIGAMTIVSWNKSIPIAPFLKSADAALYEAKSEGRNKVIFAKSAIHQP